MSAATKKQALGGYEISNIAGIYMDGKLVVFVTDEENYNPFEIHETRLVSMNTAKNPGCGVVSFEGALYMTGCKTMIPKQQSVFVDAGGKVYVWGGGDDQSESKVPVNDERVTFKSTKEISGKAYSVGTLRTVFRRDAPNNWVKLDKGLHGTPELEKQALADNAGFNDIDGFSDNDIYACGDGGDCWHFDGKIWTRIDLPVNSMLTVICCAGDDYVYIGTNDGLLLKGCEDDWTILKHDIGAEITALVWFKEKVYYSDAFWVYELINDQPRKVDFGDANPSQFGLLYGGDDVLISAGTNNVVRFDGSKWDSLLTPFDLI